MSSELYIGIQGATREAILAAANERGEIVAVQRMGPLALRVNRDLRTDFVDGLRGLASELGFASPKQIVSQLRGLCVAMSGVFQDGDEFAVNQLLVETGFVGDFKTVTCEDVWADLAAAGFDEGAVFLVSTGSNVFVRGSSGEHLNVGGWGSEIDDLGSGFFVGRLALGKILQHVDVESGEDAVIEEPAKIHVNWTEIHQFSSPKELQESP